VIAEGRDEIGGERDGLAIFEQKRETLGELDDEPGPELAWEFDFDEALRDSSKAAGSRDRNWK
jgi:hypothetical protein